jgi:hypothetical protein
LSYGRFKRTLFRNAEQLRGPFEKFVDWRQCAAVISPSGWSVVRSASLAKGGTSKERPSPHLHEVPTRSNKVSPRTMHTALVYYTLSIRNENNKTAAV